MSDFGYGGGHHRDFRFHRHHRHDWGLPPPLDLDPIASAMDVDPDMGCDPYTPGFRVFGDDQDAADDATDDGPADDGSGGQGGVLDAATQVAQGVADVIAPGPSPQAYMPAPVFVAPPFHRHHHHHHPRFAEPRAPLSRWELERIERERLRRLALERGHRRFYGDLPFQGAMGQAINPNPMFRYGPNGYRPRGPQHFGMGHGHGHGGMMHHGHGHGHGHGHSHGHHHHQGGGGQGQLPPGSYQASCEQCTYDGQTLSCQCRDTSQNLQSTSMQTDPMGTGGISNHNGQLVQAQS